MELFHLLSRSPLARAATEITGSFKFRSLSKWEECHAVRVVPTQHFRHIPEIDCHCSSNTLSRPRTLVSLLSELCQVWCRQSFSGHFWSLFSGSNFLQVNFVNVPIKFRACLLVWRYVKNVFPKLFRKNFAPLSSCKPKSTLSNPYGAS